MYYRGASAAILVYDITDASTFDAVRIWLEELKQNHHLPSSGDDPPLIIYIVGAKADLASKKREVTQERARKSLHAWFPPPPKEPPPSSKPSSTSSSYGRVGGLSYIRPRFTSLTTVPTAPPPKVDVSPAAAALNRAKSARVVPLGKRLNGDGSAPGDWRRQAAGARERRWSDAMMWDNAMREEEHSPTHSNNTSPNDDDDFNVADDEELYPLEKGMELFEVSAKDNAGVQNLFAHMIDNIIRRRHLIESERVERERNSVVLKPMSSWGNDGDDTASRSSRDPMDAHHKNGGWSCCSS
jgi:Ras family